MILKEGQPLTSGGVVHKKSVGMPSTADETNDREPSSGVGYIRLDGKREIILIHIRELCQEEAEQRPYCRP